MRAYRRDIDGLRAIAVLPVVVFHIAQSYLRGGYVGVDIFFVISGYLISSHIMADAAAGRFDLLDFYRRRIRRILPAFVALLTVVTALVVWRFFPIETIKYAGSLLAALGSVSNLYFWRDAGYFQPTVKSLPLLHTWSLAVEEQFYLVFPLIIMGVTRWAPRRLTLIVTGLLGLSLALSAASVTAFPSGGFYLLPTRAWELLIGTVLALGVIPAIRNPFVRNLVAATGLALIAGSMMLFTQTTPFPWIAALAPWLCAALIIHSGQAGTWVSRLLSLRPLVFIGLISCSLYLWHWSIMVFQRYDALLLVTAVAGLVVLALVLIGTQGLPGRFPAGAVRMAIAGDASSLERQLSGQPFEADRLFQIAARQHGFGYVSLIDALCSSRRCQAVAGDGAPMLFDGDHATPAGARVIAGRISDGLVAQSGVAPPPTGSPKPRSEPAPLSRINGPGPAG
ncbi:acyltransferase family protein [Caulobacter sp. DWR2-3-1b2]|uniref:acyltransferase family protein n=1 Tax=unclassified Caulobacter TaxID=2648921 RepID=UPI003CFAE3F8